MATYTYNRKITDEQVCDIMESALQGIAYWADEVKLNKDTTEDIYLSEALVRGYTLKIHNTEEDTWENLTLQRFLNGLSQRTSFNEQNFDMADGDAIVQYALFGELRYA